MATRKRKTSPVIKKATLTSKKTGRILKLMKTGRLNRKPRMKSNGGGRRRRRNLA